MSMRQGKNWGYTTEIFRNAMVSAHHLEVNEGGYCSEHYHEHKYNQFYVISGELEITIWREDKKGTRLVDKTILKAGQSSAVSPGFWHMFRGLTKCDAIEHYQVLLNEPDIKRRTVGGMDK